MSELDPTPEELAPTEEKEGVKATFSDLPGLLKTAYIISIILIIVHVIVLAAVLYWQIFEPTNLTFKAYLKGITHLNLFESDMTAIILFCVLWVIQLICLFLYTAWFYDKSKMSYYVIAVVVVLGLYTYMMPFALLLLGLMLPTMSLQHFGMESFDDLF